MSVEALAAVMNHSRATGTARLVLIGIANHHGDGGAWPSKATLARYAHVTPRNVQKALRTLEALGEVRIHVQRGGTADWEDTKRPNRYDVLVMCPPWCDRTSSHRDTRGEDRPLGNLWKTGESEATPGVGGDSRGESDATPGGESEATPKPSNQPSMNSGVAVVPEPQAARVTIPRNRPKPASPSTRTQCLTEAREALKAAQERNPA